MSSLTVVGIERKEGYLLSESEIMMLVSIYQSNNLLYQPTLHNRLRVDEAEDLFPLLYDTLMKRIDEGHIFYLIYVDGALVGFNTHSLARGVIKTSEYSLLEIGTTSIAREYQNRGIGKALYQRIEDDAVNYYHVDAITRSTWSTNERQLHLYEKYGYKPYIRLIENWGVEGIDTLRFYKVLEEA